MGVDPAKDVVERVRIAADVDAGPRLIGRGRIERALAGKREAGGVEGDASTERVGDRVALIGRQGRLQRGDFAREGGLNQHCPGDVFGIGRHVKKADSAGKRMTDVNERRRYGRGFYEPVQVVDDVAQVGRAAGGVAKAEPGAIVGADARPFADLFLHMSPGRHRIAGAGVENDGRIARADTIEVETPGAVHRDQALRRGIDGARGGAPGGNPGRRDGER